MLRDALLLPRTVRRCFCSWGIVLLIASCLHAQDKNSSVPSPNIYRNFLGTWEGDSDYYDSGQLKHDRVSIVITEESTKHRMRLDYVYTGDKGSSNKVRFIRLDPAKESMEINDKGFETDKYKTEDLEKFAQTGLGEFIALESHSIGNPPRNRTERLTLSLDAGRLTYEWAASNDGKEFKTYSRFKFTRKR